MKKTILSALAVGILSFGLSSCNDENVPGAGDPRLQLKEVKATPGDEEIELSWVKAENSSPTDYLIKFVSAGGQTVSINAGNVSKHLVTDLVNGHRYEFTVQAVYGKLLSSPVSVVSAPVTERLIVSDLAGTASPRTVVLTWSRPSLNVAGYTLEYFMEDSPGDVSSVSLGSDKETATIENLEDDKNYTFLLTANYAKGGSEPARLTLLVAGAIPYTYSPANPAENQPVTFNFNTEGYPTATDIAWTFPDLSSLSGTQVAKAFLTKGTHTVKLSAKVDGNVKNWNITVDVREYMLFCDTWLYAAATNQKYNGFRGTTPVFSPDGKTIYVQTRNLRHALYAFDTESGALKWSCDPAEGEYANYNMLTVNHVTGDIYYGTQSGDYFYAVTAAGTLKWRITGTGGMQSCAAAVSADGTTVFAGNNDGKVFSINAATGAKNWTYDSGKKVGALLSYGNVLIAGIQNTTETIRFIDTAEGSDKYTPISLSYNVTELAGFAVSSDKKTLYVPQHGGYVSSLSLTDFTLKVNSFKVGTDNMYEPVVSPLDGSVFLPSKNGYVYNIAPDLSAINWNAGPGTANYFNYLHPSVDTEGNFYIAGGTNSKDVGNVNFIFDKTGAEKARWTYLTANGPQPNQHATGACFLNGVMYTITLGDGTAIANSQNNGMLVGKYVGGQLAGGWSTHGGNPCGSCYLVP